VARGLTFVPSSTVHHQPRAEEIRTFLHR
jgi:hypothetical protein